MSVAEQAGHARAAARRLVTIEHAVRNAALAKMGELLDVRAEEVYAANARDLELANESNLAYPLARRLEISEKKLTEMRAQLAGVQSLADPIGCVLERRELDDGLILEQQRVPIGVLGIIFESRPDALVQIASLALKSGNAVILKGGSEALNSNRLLFDLFVQAAESTDPRFSAALQLVETREEIGALLELDELVDLIIPRGSSALVRHIQQNTRIPVLGHAEGVCHVYIDQSADAETAVRIAVDSKTQYPAVCNAAETLLVHRERAAELLPRIAAAMPEVELRADDAARAYIAATPAIEADWSAEYNALVLAVRVVDGLDEAIEHISAYGSHHTDAIVTTDSRCAERFLAEVDSSSVLWNASTRFADGFRYGLGAEVGIATGKIHARGPVGLAGLTTTKYVVRGSGQIVAEYADGTRSFTHRELPTERSEAR